MHKKNIIIYNNNYFINERGKITNTQIRAKDNEKRVCNIAAHKNVSAFLTKKLNDYMVHSIEHETFIK